jgi:hypothetical protein
MGLRQTFRFHYASSAEVGAFLRGFASEFEVDDRGEFFVFRPRTGPPFTFDCELVAEGLRSDRAGNYFEFLGMFVEALTGQFGKVEIEDT